MSFREHRSDPAPSQPAWVQSPAWPLAHRGDLTSVPQAVYLQNGTNSSASLPHKSAVRVKAENRHAALEAGPRSPASSNS